ncbi:DUF1501 domain-containing protein [Tautonia marina]|uniref:DUF1501 domain-containing protein n=1 Tax=Tautonia marina TaxID=2653855 RepID=UPI0012606D20|nr:DUF1501 domain-containing protein [Tautonia marina]
MTIRGRRESQDLASRLPLPSRRDWLRTSSCGFGMLALSGLLSEQSQGGDTGSTARARSVIFCFMDGGPSHVDTFDLKPALARYQGQAIGEQAVSKKSQSAASRVWMGSPWRFRRRGEAGLWVSDLLPYLAECADELCVVRSLEGEQPLHGQQSLLLHTGRVTGQAPSFGSWVSYGLASERSDLPGYVLLNNDWIPNGGFENFAPAYLPASHGATMIRSRGVPVDGIEPSDPVPIQRRKLDLLAEQDDTFARLSTDGDVIESAIMNYETAFRMQTSVPEVADVSGESEETRRLYGLDRPDDHQRFYALQCLRARRLVERGVRFVEITCPLTHPNNSPWDQHGELKKYHTENALISDQPIAALIVDLKRRGLLDSTIVVWAGEMGRTPHTPAISERAGRDHHVDGYSIFLAGGGFRGGFAFGQTDDFGNRVVEHPLTIHDIHATVLHQLGLDHEQLSFRHGGRDQRLTDVHGHVVRDLIDTSAALSGRLG